MIQLPIMLYFKKILRKSNFSINTENFQQFSLLEFNYILLAYHFAILRKEVKQLLFSTSSIKERQTSDEICSLFRREHRSEG